MKPKYLLTHPNGKLMIEKALEGLNLNIFDRIIVTIVKPHDDQYQAKTILEQCFAGMADKVSIYMLDDFTTCVCETVYLTISGMNVKGAVVIKDADNYVRVDLPQHVSNMVVGCDLHKHTDINQVAAKSFLIVNEQGLLLDIIEKKIVSNIICLGVYCFQDSAEFIEHYLEIMRIKVTGEMYISHLISYMLSKRRYIFTLRMADNYEDWGTLREWLAVQKNFQTYFVDLDGIIITNSGKYGRVNWSNNEQLIEENVSFLKRLQENGAQIVITTSRTEEFREGIEKLLNEAGLSPYAILMGLNHTRRILINDFAPTNPFPSAVAVSIPRNSILSDYF
jgi:hypothetical protein